MGISIYIDDRKEFPKGFNGVRTFDGCIGLLKYGGELDIISLDYDLGEKRTGLDILIWMKENAIRPKHINIHSTHIFGAYEMLKYAEENFPDSAVTSNTG